MMTITDTKLVEKLREWYLGAADPATGNGWRERAAKCLRYYNGTGQWAESVKMLLDSQNRPALTINRILPTVNVVWGHLIQNRAELRLEALRRGTKEIANLGSSLIKHAMDTCQGYDASSDAFRDGIITGKGWTTADQVYDRDPVSGELVVEAPNPLFIYEDPRNSNYNANAGEYVFRERFWTKNKLKAYFPRKYDEAMDATHADWLYVPGLADAKENRYAGEMYNLLMGMSSSTSDPNGELAGAVIRECWWKEYEAVKMATVRMGGRSITARIMGKDDEAKLAEVTAQNPGLEVKTVSSVICTLNLAVMVGDLLLKHEKDPLNGMNNFPYVRFSPYWLLGEPFGVVDNLLGPQDELNKSRSNLLHDANINTNPGWKAAKANDNGKTMIQQYGSTPGVLLEEHDFGGKIERIEPGGLSQAHAQLADKNAADIQEISGANPNLMGTPTERVESGRARLIQQEAGLKVLAPVIGNYYRSQSVLGDMIWDFIRHNEVYTPEEIEAVVDIDIINALGGMAGVVEVMNRWDAGSYAVKAVPTKTTSTWRDVQLEEVVAFTEILAKAGLQMPPAVGNALAIEVLELSSFPGSSKIADMMKQQPAMPAMQEMQGGGGNTKQGTRAGAVVAASGGGPQ